MRFPKAPTREWYAVDLLNHARQAGAAAVDLVAPLVASLANHKLDRATFFAALDKYGSRSTKNLVEENLRSLRR